MEIDKMFGLGSAKLAMTSFVACRHPAESCGHNGLPLTPNSIAILGQAEGLKSLEHQNLCTYLDFARGKNERVICVSEFYENNLKAAHEVGPKDLLHIAGQVLALLDFLQSQEVVVMNLSTSTVLLSDDNTVKLFNYGLGHMTNYGVLVGFPLFDPRTVAPEVLATGPLPERSTRTETEAQEAEEGVDSISHILPAPKPPYSVASSIWTLGMLLFTKAMGLQDEQGLWPSLKVPQVIRKVLSLSVCDDVVSRLAREQNCQKKALHDLPSELIQLMELCLNPKAEARPSPRELLILLGQSHMPIAKPFPSAYPTMTLRCRELCWPPLVEDLANDESALDALTLQEIYYLWVLAGGDTVGELRRHGLMVSLPPVLTLPKILVNEGHALGQVKERCTLYDPKIMSLPMKQLTSCFHDVTPVEAFPLLMTNQPDKSSDKANDDMASLPLVIKERDVRYQFRRVVLYRRLLQGYPYMRPSIWKEARVDAIPLYRAYIWAALLGIEHDVRAAYEAVDKEAWTCTDRQIEVDIPRCHQYNSLLASPEGHRKFKRILKAWVVANPQYVYWQGLDSLCAPFLYLNFNDEALAFACLSAFIPKYLHGMFRKDNAAVIQEYLAKFSHLQAFHDPHLFNHLDGIGFIPDLYAIPWVLTMFAHVFPLHNIFHLWDKLLLGNAAFPLCVALAILYQLRERLLAAEFNDCILLFSDLPAIDIEQCVNDSIQIFCSTPKSLTYRKYGSPTPISATTGAVDLTLERITLEMQKTDKVPRISGEELLALLGLRSLAAPEDTGFNIHQKARALTIDVRPKAEFKMGALPESINIPTSGAFGDDGELQGAKDGLHQLSYRRSKIICVVGSSGNEDARTFAEHLLRLNYNRLCLLHVGIEIFRTVGVLCVPNT